jgi:hypothetical protein
VKVARADAVATHKKLKAAEARHQRAAKTAETRHDKALKEARSKQEAALKSLKALQEDHAAQLQAAEEKRDEARRDLTSVKGKLGEVSAELEKTRSALESKEEELGAQRQRIAELDEQLDERDRVNEDMRRQLEDVDDEIGVKAAEMQVARERARELEAALAAKCEELARAEAALSEAKAEAEHAQQLSAAQGEVEERLRALGQFGRWAVLHTGGFLQHVFGPTSTLAWHAWGAGDAMNGASEDPSKPGASIEELEAVLVELALAPELRLVREDEGFRLKWNDEGASVSHWIGPFVGALLGALTQQRLDVQPARDGGDGMHVVDLHVS